MKLFLKVSTVKQLSKLYIKYEEMIKKKFRGWFDILKEMYVHKFLIENQISRDKFPFETMHGNFYDLIIFYKIDDIFFNFYRCNLTISRHNMHLRPLKCYWLCMKILFDTSRRIIPVTSRNNSLEKTNRLMALQMLPVIIKMTRQYTRKKLAITIATTCMRMHVARERVEQSIAIIIFHLQKQFLIFGN